MLKEKTKTFLEKQRKLYVILLFIFSVIGLVAMLHKQYIVFSIIIIILCIIGFLVNNFLIVRVKNMLLIITVSIFAVPDIVHIGLDYPGSVIENMLFLVLEILGSIFLGSVFVILARGIKKFNNWQQKRQGERMGRNFFKHDWSSLRCYEIIEFYEKKGNNNFGMLKQYLKQYFREINNYELYKKIKVSFSSFDTNELKEISNFLDIVITLGEPDVKKSTEFLEIFKFINIFISAGISFKLQVVFKQLLQGIPFFIIAIIVYFSLIVLVIICGSIYNRIGKRKDIKMAKVFQNIINNILKERGV